MRWGERVGASVQPPLWVALTGPLGAGKSVFVRAVCRGAGVPGHIPSPSFTLVQQYRSSRGFTIYHVDLFRLTPGDPIAPLGWDDLIGIPGLVLLEWASRVQGQQPDDRWEIFIDYCGDPEKRVVRALRAGRSPDLVSW